MALNAMEEFRVTASKGAARVLYFLFSRPSSAVTELGFGYIFGGYTIPCCF